MSFAMLAKPYKDSKESNRRYLTPTTLLDSLETQMSNNLSNFLKKYPEFSDEFVEDACVLPPSKRRKQLLSESSAKLRFDSNKECKPIYKLEPVLKDEKITIELNCAQYNPESISIRIIKGKLHIQAHHESNQDDSYEHFEIKKFLDLPENAEPELAKSRLSESGLLHIEIPVSKSKDFIVPVIRECSVSIENIPENANKNTAPSSEVSLQESSMPISNISEELDKGSQTASNETSDKATETPMKEDTRN